MASAVGKEANPLIIHGTMKPKNGREFFISEPPQDRGGTRRFILIPAYAGTNIKDSTLHQSIWEKRLAVVFQENAPKEGGFIVSGKWIPDNSVHVKEINNNLQMFSSNIEIIIKIASKNYRCDAIWMYMANDVSYEHYRKECSEVFNKELAEFNRQKIEKEMKGEADLKRGHDPVLVGAGTPRSAPVSAVASGAAAASSPRTPLTPAPSGAAATPVTPAIIKATVALPPSSATRVPLSAGVSTPSATPSATAKTVGAVASAKAEPSGFKKWFGKKS